MSIACQFHIATCWGLSESAVCRMIQRVESWGLLDKSRLLLSEENLGNLVEHHPVLLSEILAHYDYGLL